MGKASVLLVLLSAGSLQFASWNDNLSVTYWPPNVARWLWHKSAKWCHKKLLDSARSLVTNFQLKSAKSSEILFKKSVRCLFSEPYRPHSIPPIGGARCHRGPKIPVPSPLSTPEKASIPKLKYEALEIIVVRGPIEGNVHHSFFRPLWKQGIYTLQLLLGAPLKAK